MFANSNLSLTAKLMHIIELSAIEKKAYCEYRSKLLYISIDLNLNRIFYTLRCVQRKHFAEVRSKNSANKNSIAASTRITLLSFCMMFYGLNKKTALVEISDVPLVCVNLFEYSRKRVPQ